MQFTSVAEKLSANFSKTCKIPSFTRQVRSVNDTYKSLIKLVDRNWESISHFLTKEFDFPLSECVEQSVSRSSESESLKSKSPEVCQRAPTVVTPVKTRGDCAKCPSAKKLNFSLKNSLREEKRKCQVLKSDSCRIKKIYKVRETRQKVKRHEVKLEDLRQAPRKKQIEFNFLQRSYKKQDMTINALSKENVRLASENKKKCNKISSLESTCSNLKKAVRENTIEISKVKQYSDYLAAVSVEKHEEEFYNSRDGKMYNLDVRRCIYQALLCDVPVQNCGVLLRAFMNIVNKRDINVPSPSTCAQMAYELGVLSTIMLAEFMLNQRHLCLSWDATTLEGAHLNEIHLTANKVRCLVLDVGHLPGGKTADYVYHLISALTEAAGTYARYADKSPETILASFKASISSTLTDRAAVNACVTRQLC